MTIGTTIRINGFGRSWTWELRTHGYSSRIDSIAVDLYVTTWQLTGSVHNLTYQQNMISWKLTNNICAAFAKSYEP